MPPPPPAPPPASPPTPPWSPAVDEQVELAKAPYKDLLPDRVAHDMGQGVAMVLSRHPVGIGMMNRIGPSLIVPAPPDEDEKARLFRGYQAVHMWQKVMSDVRRAALAKPQKQFVLPDASAAALVAFLAWAGTPEDAWTEAPDEIMRGVVLELVDAIVAAQVLGLLQALDAKPGMLVQWGDIGRGLGETLPRLREVRRGALARLGPVQKQLFNAYQLCGWDAVRCAKRLSVPERVIMTGAAQAFRALGIAFRIQLTGNTEGADVDAFR